MAKYSERRGALLVQEGCSPCADDTTGRGPGGDAEACAEDSACGDHGCAPGVVIGKGSQGQGQQESLHSISVSSGEQAAEVATFVMALLVADLCFGPPVWFWDKHLWWGYAMAVVVGIPLYPIGIVGVGAVVLGYIRSN